MPEISRFFGIVIRMYDREHPPPHFHVEYAGEWAVVYLRGALSTAGRMRPRVRRMVLEWARRHRTELLANWDSMRAGREPKPIEPLE